MFRKFTVALLILALPAFAGALDLDNYRIVDLSHSYDERTLYWPTSPSAFEKQTLEYGDSRGRLLLLGLLGLHSGTWWHASGCTLAFCLDDGWRQTRNHH